MLRRIAMLASIAVMAGAAVSGAAKAQAPAAGCGSSPTAVPCVFAEKAVEAERAACRSKGGPEAACSAVPYGRDTDPAALAAYRSSWLHRTAQFQFALGDTVPLRDAQWLGTHNSFNANANGLTVSHSDSNQQLTLAQQLDADVRSLELDLHFVRGKVLVCHGRPANEQHAGCTTEPTFAEVLPEIVAWVTANPDQVLLLYLEDALGADGYAPALAALEAALGDRIYRPAATPETCAQLPLGVSRRDVRAAGRSVVVVGDCRSGWKSAVFGWKGNTSTEAGNSTGYTCASPITRDRYATTLVRFFEDSTFLATVTAPQESMAAREARSLTPAKVAQMTACGVNLFGFDQFDPNDGRVAASIWSWAPDEPRAGDCTVLRDGRWYAAPCAGTAAGTRPAACRTADGWVLSPAVAAPGAAASCRSTGGTFSAPRTGEEAAALRAVADGTREVWLAVERS